MMQLSFDQSRRCPSPAYAVFFTNGFLPDEVKVNNVGRYLLKDGSKRDYYTTNVGLVIVTPQLVNDYEISLELMKKIINECLVFPVVHERHLVMIKDKEASIRASAKKAVFVAAALKAIGDDPEGVKQKILDRIMTIDWYTDYSDDPSVRRAGGAAIKQLMTDIKAHRLENVLTMYEDYCKAS